MFFLFFMVYDVLHVTELQHFDSLTQLFAATLFFALFLISLWYVKNDHKLEITQHELETHKLYTESQKSTLSDLRGFKHDIDNIHLTINGLFVSGSTTALGIYLEELIGQRKPSEVIEASEIAKKIPEIAGIVIGSIIRTEIKGITFNIAIAVSGIKLGYFSALDFSRIVGILLDNAREAAETSARKIMEFSIWEKDGRFEIIIANTCDDEVDTSRINDSGYSTKPGHGGEGLPQLRRCLEKYNAMGHSMEIHTEFKDGYFIQVLKIDLPRK